jgi:hypothetical protein
VTPLGDWPPEQCVFDHGFKKASNVLSAVSNYTERVAAGEGCAPRHPSWPSEAWP